MTEPAAYRAGRRILDTALNQPGRTALVIDDETWSYGELVGAAGLIAARIEPEASASQPITAVMAQRHVSSYAGIRRRDSPVMPMCRSTSIIPASATR